MVKSAAKEKDKHAHLYIPDSEALEKIRAKTITVASGKGGVGKTTTAVNLALYFASKGKRVALADLDPLSNCAVLVDLPEKKAVSINADKSLREFITPVYKNFHLIFPYARTSLDESLHIKSILFKNGLQLLLNSYDILVLDLPAGIGFEETISYYSFSNHLVLVTNPEPTAHVAAGAFLKQIYDNFGKSGCFLWHNRYANKADQGFNSKDVIANYNSNMPDEEKLKAEAITTSDIAFVPSDAALDMLQGEPSPHYQIYKNLYNAIELLSDDVIYKLRKILPFAVKTINLIEYFILKHHHLNDAAEILSKLENYFKNLYIGNYFNADTSKLKKISIFSKDEKILLKKYITSFTSSSIIRNILRLNVMIGNKIESIQNAATPFGTVLPVESDLKLDKEISSLLVQLSQETFIDKTNAYVLLFYFAVFKLLQSKTIVNLILNFIPKKKNKAKELIRDRASQIQQLIENNKSSRADYIKLIQTIFPIIVKQLHLIGNTFDINNLLIVDESKNIHKAAYVKLLHNFIHNTIYSGLSIVFGFEFRNTTKEFIAGAESLLEQIN